MFDNRHMELRRVSNVITKSDSTVARFQFYLLAVHSRLVGHMQEKSATCLCLSLRYRLHCVFYTGVIMPLSYILRTTLKLHFEINFKCLKNA